MKTTIISIITFILGFATAVTIAIINKRNRQLGREKEPKVEYVWGDTLGSCYKRVFFKSNRMIDYEGDFFNDTIRDGYYRKYLLDGRLNFEAHYADGKLSGLQRDYHKNGFVQAEGIFGDGKKFGVWKIYYPNGQPKCIQRFDSTGTFIGGICFNEDGSLK